jgi:hypothetical protein
MKNPFVQQENKTDWYINHNSIDKFLQIDRNDNQPLSRSVHIIPEENHFRKMTKRIHKHRA